MKNKLTFTTQILLCGALILGSTQAGATEALTPSNDRGTVTWQSPTGMVACDLTTGNVIAERSTDGILTRDGRYSLTQNAPEGGLTLWHVGHPENKATLLADAPWWQMLRPFAYLGFFATFSEDGSLLAINEGDGAVSVWDTATSQLRWRGRIANLDQVDPDSRNLRLKFSPDGERLVWLAVVPEAGVVDAATGAPLAFFQRSDDEQMHIWANPSAIDISPDGDTLAVAGDSHYVYLYDLNTGRLNRRVGLEGAGLLVGAQLALNGRALLLNFSGTPANNDLSRVVLTEIETGKVLFDLPHQKVKYGSMGLSANGTTLALETVGAAEANVHLYDVLTGKLVLTAPKCTE